MSTNDSFYYEGRDLEAMSFAPNYHEWILDYYAPYVGDHLTEIGAGTGTFSEIVLNRFEKPLTMVEPSESMLNQLKARLSSHLLFSDSSVIQGFTTALKDFPKTDTFFYVNVMEHIENDVDELKWMYNNLENGGHVCLFSPAMPFLFGSHDERVGHFRRYTKKELISKTENAGFKVQKAIYFDLLGVPLWWINFVLLKSAMKPGAVHLYDTLIVPILRKLEPNALLPFGKNVLVIGKK